MEWEFSATCVTVCNPRLTDRRLMARELEMKIRRMATIGDEWNSSRDAKNCTVVVIFSLGRFCKHPLFPKLPAYIE